MANPYQALYTFLDTLKTIKKRGGGGLAIVPRNVPHWKVETTKGGELDYLAWPSVDYNTEKTLWTQLSSASEKNLPWPLGEGLIASNMLDRLVPTDYPENQIPAQRIFVILARVGTVNEVVSNMDKGLRLMDPNYPIIKLINPWWYAGGVGALIAVYFLLN